MNVDKPFYKIIRELVSEMNIEVDEFSFGYINRLKKDGKIRNLVRYKFDLNTVTATEIADDKYACYEILKASGIPVIEHAMIFNPKTRCEYFTKLDIEIAKNLFDKYNKKIVIKANNSYQGKEVFLINEKDKIEETIEGIFSRNNDSLSICPFEKIKNEYRMIILDNECLFGYKKEILNIIGDGIKNIGEFISEKKIEFVNYDLDLDYVPKVNEKVALNWKFNLSGGAIPLPINDESKSKILEKIAIDAGKAINIRFASVDIVETENEEFKVMEINASVCMNKFAEEYENGYEIAKSIYRKALEKSFE